MTDRLVSSLNPLFRICSGLGAPLFLRMQDESLLKKDGGGGLKHQVLTWGGYFVLVCLSSARGRRSPPPPPLASFCWTEEAAVGVASDMWEEPLELGAGQTVFLGRGIDQGGATETDSPRMTPPSWR